MAVWPLVVALLCCISVIGSKPVGNDVCVVNGKVYHEGATFPVPEMGGNCTRYKCHKGGYKEFKVECEDRLGICKPLNAKETVNCVTKQCLTGDSGTIFYIQTNKCMDADGKCHKPGERFPYVIDDVRKQNCTCTMSMDNPDVTYSCH